ncbi:uncharacterized protein LOC108655882 isoform X2 [Drosophila navojoa]|uniref:uncharacterized protein LOC108655882 isoform X2 n=1 Tax=Drosophila navojoa TaxID=7232 RepID=UPI0011BE1598|nr:uncharacterized protein LOC108655882 isoform X2 [Drosophila navojoa]
MMSGQPQLLPPLLLLLLCISFGCIAVTFGQGLAVPTRQLLAPSLRFAESFEIFDGDEADDADEVMGTGEQLRQLLGQELTSAVAPLTAAPLAVLSRRRPGIMAPRSAAAAVRLFADSAESDESDDGEDSDEADNDADTDTDTGPAQQPVPQPQPQPQPEQVPQEVPQQLPQETPQQEYNPYRDNFNDRNADGSYVFGYSLPNGVRRWERGFFSEHQHHGLVVEGFYAQPRHYGHSIQYELRCYRADAHGYQPLAVEYLQQPPRVRRFELPNVSCLSFNR